MSVRLSALVRTRVYIYVRWGERLPVRVITHNTNGMEKQSRKVGTERGGMNYIYLLTLNVQMRYGAEERRNKMTLFLVFNSQIAFTSYCRTPNPKISCP